MMMVGRSEFFSIRTIFPTSHFIEQPEIFRVQRYDNDRYNYYCSVRYVPARNPTIDSISSETCLWVRILFKYRFETTESKQS